MLLVQEYLLAHSFSDLMETHGVKAKPSRDRSKFSLDYDQIKARRDDPIACECRGLVIRPKNFINDELSTVGETTIIARPLDRFFNDGERTCASIDWNTARIEEKLDGTMCILYFDDVRGEWCVGTRSVCEADIPFSSDVAPFKFDGAWSFGELFRYSAQETLKFLYGFNVDGAPKVTYARWLSTLNKNKTYVYELTSPLNRVVVKYDEYRITLISVRDTVSGRHERSELTHELGPALLLPQVWYVKNLDDLKKFIENTDPSRVEGAVIVDANWNRLKVKSKKWVLASRAKDFVSLSKRNVITAILNGSMDDIIPLLSDDLVNYIDKMTKDVITYCAHVDVTFNLLSVTSNDRKEFALNVRRSGEWEPPYYVLYSRRFTSTLDWLRALAKNEKLPPTTIDQLLRRISSPVRLNDDGSTSSVTTFTRDADDGHTGISRSTDSASSATTAPSGESAVTPISGG